MSEHTMTGLLATRADLFGEAERIRDRLAEIRNDLGAIDRTLGALGYEGDLDAEMPRQKREVVFGRGELTRVIYGELRQADGPLSSRDIGRSIVALHGEDVRDRRYLSDLTKRASKALGQMYREGTNMRLTNAKGNNLWLRRHCGDGYDRPERKFAPN